jgi:hypothetical protein
MLKALKNLFLKGYKSHREAVVISCFYNSQNNVYRQKAFELFYESIKTVNYRIIECVIGNSASQLSVYNDKNIKIVRAEELLWHKETLLNQVISTLPSQFKYVFWLDADIIFDNEDWLTDGVKALQYCSMIQPFEFCIHLNRDERKPNFDYKALQKQSMQDMLNGQMWRSFCSNVHSLSLHSDNYNEHGHVGFAWGARREVLEQVPLYEKALIGGADHIIAHAAANQVQHNCIAKTFTEDIETVQEYMQKLSNVVNGKIGFCQGSLFHIWHGEIEKRQYHQRIKNFTSQAKGINERDGNGFYKSNSPSIKVFVTKYYEHREVNSFFTNDFSQNDTSNDLTLDNTLSTDELTDAIIEDMLDENENENENCDTNDCESNEDTATDTWETNFFS